MNSQLMNYQELLGEKIYSWTVFMNMKSDVGSWNEELDIHEPTSKVHEYHEPISTKVHEPTVWLHEQFKNLTKTFMNQ